MLVPRRNYGTAGRARSWGPRSVAHPLSQRRCTAFYLWPINSHSIDKQMIKPTGHRETRPCCTLHSCIAWGHKVVHALLASFAGLHKHKFHCYYSPSQTNQVERNKSNHHGDIGSTIQVAQICNTRYTVN